jgi:hypothetical protein
MSLDRTCDLPGNLQLYISELEFEAFNRGDEWQDHAHQPLQSSNKSFVTTACKNNL